MLAASMFSEFCAELCHYVCSDDDTADHSDHSSGFIEKLSSDGMFLIPLDKSSSWFRYHHFFRDFLTGELQKMVTAEEFLSLHGRASHWFESRGLIERAIRHAIWAKDEERALDLFSIYRIRLLTNRQWKEHESLLKLFSEDNRAYQPVLLISRSWVHIYNGKMNDAFTLISSTDAKIDKTTLNSSQRSNLEGELNTIHAYAAYYQGNGDLAVNKSQLAIELLDPANIYPLGLAWIFLGGGFQMLGKTDEIVPLLFENLESVRYDHVRSGILHVICYIHWLNGNLEDLKVTALKLIELGIQSNNYESRTYGHVFAGHYYYQTNQLESANEHYLQAYEYRFHILGSVRIHAVIGLIMTSFQLGYSDRAFDFLEELEINTASSGNAYMNMLGTLARAELEFRSGNLERAFQLTQNIGNIPVRPQTNFFSPELCVSKIWIYFGIPTCTGEVAGILDGMERRLKKLNNRRFNIDIFALKSLLLFEQGKEADSFKFIGKALRLARPGGFLRVFRDMGEKMKEVLLASPYSATEDDFVGQILSTFNEKEEDNSSLELSDREHQILNFLSDKLSNKEIGAKLFITEKTVKNHLNSIYRKLGARGRREALVKARQWMLL
jgi:LuxR family maltose regulon positive regulatory protein